MQAVLDSIPTTLAIIIIVVIILLLVALVFLGRRIMSRRVTSEEEPAGELGTSIDYTTLPEEEEPQGWRDRFAQLSLAGKILLVVVPLLLLVGVAVLLLLFQPTSEAQPEPLPTAVPLDLTITDAVLTNPTQIRVRGDTTLPNDTPIQVQLLANGEPFGWLDAASTTTRVSGGEIDVRLNRAAEGFPNPSPDDTYTMRLEATLNGQTLTAESELEIPSPLAADFYGAAAAAAPTATASPTGEAAAPTAAAEESPTATVAAATPTPTAEVADRPAVVINGGNLRRQPFITDNVITQVDANETVTLLERTPNAQWYRVRTSDGTEGWFSVTLLRIDAATAAEVPVASIVTVFTAGALYEQPDASSDTVGQVNLNEVVTLLQKTPDAEWYQVENLRNETGWVRAGLLGVPPEVDLQVPVQGTTPPAAATPTLRAGAATQPSPTPTEVVTAEPAGLTTVVRSGGFVRDVPNDQGVMVDEVNAGETVELLARNDDDTWFRIRTIRNFEGWVNRTLLTLDPGVIARLPVRDPLAAPTPTP